MRQAPMRSARVHARTRCSCDARLEVPAAGGHHATHDESQMTPRHRSTRSVSSWRVAEPASATEPFEISGLRPHGTPRGAARMARMASYTGEVKVGGPAAVRELPGLRITKVAVGPMD